MAARSICATGVRREAVRGSRTARWAAAVTAVVPPGVLRSSTVSELAGNMWVKLEPRLPSFDVLGAISVGLASVFCALGSPVRTVAVPSLAGDSPLSVIVVTAPKRPSLTTTR